MLMYEENVAYLGKKREVLQESLEDRGDGLTLTLDHEKKWVHLPSLLLILFT